MRTIPPEAQQLQPFRRKTNKCEETNDCTVDLDFNVANGTGVNEQTLRKRFCFGLWRGYVVCSIGNVRQCGAWIVLIRRWQMIRQRRQHLRRVRQVRGRQIRCG